MARGDITIFEEFALDSHSEKHQLVTDTLKLMIVDNTLTPLASIATPTKADFVANEVSGTNYPAGGLTLSATTAQYSEAAGVGTLYSDQLSMSQHASGPTDMRWGILYNDTEAGDAAIAFVDLGAIISLVNGDVTFKFNSAATDGEILTFTVT